MSCFQRREGGIGSFVIYVDHVAILWRSKDREVSLCQDVLSVAGVLLGLLLVVLMYTIILWLTCTPCCTCVGQAYVRGVIEQKLDIFVPISHQPREIISDIIADVSAKFPEFASCARKRIRTFLKSYRRSKKLKEGGTGNSASPPNGVSWFLYLRPETLSFFCVARH